MYQKVIKRFTGIFISLLFLGVMVGAANAVTTFNMTAGTTNMTMPDATVVPMWGFALDSTVIDGGAPTPGDGVVKVPGDPLVVPPGETTVIISLTNNLPEPVSLNILGQMLTAAGGPVWTAGTSDTVVSTGSRIPGDTTARVRSFAHETPAGGGPVSYTWTNFKAGSYLLLSGTNPAKQVQMGLYAAVTQDVAAGEAYPGALYDKEIIMLYSEVDPLMHAAIVAGTYGPGGAITSSLHRDPKYFLINGMAYPDAGLEQVIFADPYDRVLVRFLNAGYETHVPQLLNMYMTMVAEDGNFYAYAREQYGAQLPAGKTLDAVIVPTIDGKFSIHDAAHHLTNAGAADPGGMLAYYTVGCAGNLTIGDGTVNVLDLGVLRSEFGRTDCHNPGIECAADINNDGRVNVLDLGLLRANFGRIDCPIP